MSMIRNFTNSLFLLTAILYSYGGPATAAAPFPTKVFMVILENENYRQAITHPFMKNLAAQGAVFTNYRAITHPSQPNYIGLISGSTKGVFADFKVTLTRNHLGNLLEAKGRSWKSYVENYPGGCDLRSTIGSYARKHNPFISFKDVQEDAGKCANIVNSAELDRDIEQGTLPDFSFYVPNVKNDGHDTGVGYADNYMNKKFGPLLKDPRFSKDMLFIVTFDEGSFFKKNQVYTVFYGEHVQAGAKICTLYNHYDLLRTIEDIFDTDTLGRNDTTAVPMEGFWKAY